MLDVMTALKSYIIIWLGILD